MSVTGNPAAIRPQTPDPAQVRKAVEPVHVLGDGDLEVVDGP